eukprot:TRINITY_DN1709_c0_g1_i1.p1 TRINITY_DN1709_c0_g1~~TRINITY_DN1709_c0_g1_i1.p1  ORF type:complete len:184 (+),score=25.36 TRINITY_DN1709_c0_g1_i1:45-596(+)
MNHMSRRGLSWLLSPSTQLHTTLTFKRLSYSTIGPVETRRWYAKKLLDDEELPTLPHDLSGFSKDTVSDIIGVPVEQLERKAMITRRSRNTMQAGKNLRNWTVTWERLPRWRERLMGWTASSDPTYGLRLSFPSVEAAEKFCKENGIDYTVKTDHTIQANYLSSNNYADKFKHKTLHTNDQIN